MISPRTILTGLLLGGVSQAGAVLAADWQRGAGISLGAYYSDNICLADRDREGRGAVTATPDVYLRGQGARTNLYLRGAVAYNSLGDSDFQCGAGRGNRGGNRQALIPSLRYAGDFELVDSWLTLESDAFVGRNSINPFEAGGGETFDGRDNTNITYDYGVGAVMERRLFKAADMRLRYRYSEQYNEVNLLGDSSEDRVEFDLGTARGSNRFSAGVSGRYSKVTYDGNERRPGFDNTLSSAEVRAALRLSSSWQITGLAGEEWNEFTSTRDDVDGSYWSAGVRWTPNERVAVEVGTGERFFGTTPRASIRYRHKRSQLTLNYARSVTFPRNLRAASDDFADPLDPDAGFDPDFGQLPGEPPVFAGQPTFIGNTPIINERLSVRYRFSGRRSTVTVSASNSQQTRPEDGGEADFSNIGATFSRQLSASLSANARLSWSEREGQGGNVGAFGQRSTTWRAGAGLSRRLGNNTTLNVGFQHTRQESDFAFNRYDENRVTVSVRHQF